MHEKPGTWCSGVIKAKLCGDRKERFFMWLFVIYFGFDAVEHFSEGDKTCGWICAGVSIAWLLIIFVSYMGTDLLEGSLRLTKEIEGHKP